MNKSPARVKMKGCLIYLRVSDESQVENFSLDNQLDYCKKYSDREGFSVLKIFREEGKSATNINRPELKELLEFATKNKDKISAVILYRYDRLSRDLLQALQLRKQFAELGIDVRSATEPVSNDPMGQMFQSLSFLFAQYESQTHKKRVTDGLNKRFTEGYYTGAYPPLGYSKAIEGSRTVLIPHEHDFPIVQQAWRLYATGTKTHRDVAEYLNNNQVRAGYNHNYKKITKKTISKLFNNKFYIGILTSKTFGEAQGRHQAMIDNETFDRVQFIMNRRATTNGLTYLENHPDFYLRRIVKHSCGKYLTAGYSKNKKGNKYGYYFCVDHRNFNIPVKEIHDKFKTFMDSLKFTDQAFELYRLILTVKFDKTLKFIEKRRRTIENEISQIKTQRIILGEKVAMGIMQDDIYKTLDKQLDNNMLALSTASSDGLIKRYELEGLLNFSNTLFSDIHKSFLASDYGQRRFLCNKLFPQGLVWDGNNFSNTQIHPIIREMQGVCEGQVSFSGR